MVQRKRMRTKTKVNTILIMRNSTIMSEQQKNRPKHLHPPETGQVQSSAYRGIFNLNRYTSSSPKSPLSIVPIGLKRFFLNTSRSRMVILRLVIELTPHAIPLPNACSRASCRNGTMGIIGLVVVRVAMSTAIAVVICRGAPLVVCLVWRVGYVRVECI